MDIQTEELLTLLKVLSDESRLSLLRLLNQDEYNVGSLAERVNLSEPTVSHHLSRLRKAGLVSLRMAGNQRFYRINESGLAHFKDLVTRIEQFPPEPESVVSDDRWIDELGWPEEDRKVLRGHTQNGKLTHLPTRKKKQLVVLRWLTTLFQPDTFYTEEEVNDVIKAVYEEDYVGLRRDLIDMGYLRRERGGGKYWLTPAEDTSA
jgi:predicted transcriptional regulator